MGKQEARSVCVHHPYPCTHVHTRTHTHLEVTESVTRIVIVLSFNLSRPVVLRNRVVHAYQGNISLPWQFGASFPPFPLRAAIHFRLPGNKTYDSGNSLCTSFKPTDPAHLVITAWKLYLWTLKSQFHLTFFSIYDHTHSIWKFPGLGLNWICRCRPTPQPQWYKTQGVSTTHTASYGNVGSLTHK